MIQLGSFFKFRCAATLGGMAIPIWSGRGGFVVIGRYTNSLKWLSIWRDLHIARIGDVVHQDYAYWAIFSSLTLMSPSVCKAGNHSALRLRQRRATFFGAHSFVAHQRVEVGVAWVHVRINDLCQHTVIQLVELERLRLRCKVPEPLEFLDR